MFAPPIIDTGLYREAIAGCDSFKSLITFSKRKAMVLAFGYALHEHQRMKLI